MKKKPNSGSEFASSQFSSRYHGYEVTFALCYKKACESWFAPASAGEFIPMLRPKAC